jgi:hypothetical protein
LEYLLAGVVFATNFVLYLSTTKMRKKKDNESYDPGNLKYVRVVSSSHCIFFPSRSITSATPVRVPWFGALRMRVCHLRRR